MKIPKKIKELADVFHHHKYELYVVGGSVRDYVMGNKPKDFDLATDATPDIVVEILKDYKLDLHGKSFAVVMVDIGEKEPIEIASFREDSTGRKPTVSTGVTIEQDVKRRDLTINALFYNIQSGEVVDLVGGLSDIDSKIIRMVGNPTERIQEDNLRVLRVIRFATRYGFSVEEKTDECLRKITSLKEVTTERIFNEFYNAFVNNPFEFCDTISKYPNIWVGMFKGIKNKSPKVKYNTIDLFLFAQLFLNEDRKSMQKWNFPNRIIDTICFFKSVRDAEINNIQKIYKEMKRLRIEKNSIKEFFEKTEIETKLLNVILKYEPVADIPNLISLGYVKSELGKKIFEIEQNRIEEIEKESRIP